MKKFIIYTLTFFTCTCIAKRYDIPKLSDTYQRSVSSSSSGAEVLSEQDFSDESSSDAKYTNREPSPIPLEGLLPYSKDRDISPIPLDVQTQSNKKRTKSYKRPSSATFKTNSAIWVKRSYDYQKTSPVSSAPGMIVSRPDDNKLSCGAFGLGKRTKM